MRASLLASATASLFLCNRSDAVSEGRQGAPANLTIRRAEFRYGPDWVPQLFELNGTANGADVTIRTTVAGNTATTQSTQSGTTTLAINPQAMLHANGIVGAYAALR